MFKTINSQILFFFSLIVILFLSACKKETLVVPNLSYNYFPTEIGKWVEYSVDSVYHAENDNENDDSVYAYHFEIKEIIDSSFTDSEGRVNEVISRYRRNDSTSVWTISDIWTQWVSSKSAYRTENNIRYHKLSFPINLTTTWNGNDANLHDVELYSYEYFHESSTVNGLNFDSTLSVVQIDENNYIERIYGNEIYATGVGLIFKERDELGKKNGVIVSGIEYRLQVKNFGFK